MCLVPPFDRASDASPSNLSSFTRYVGGVPLLRKGGCVVVVNEMHYKWSEPAHTTYKELFENVVANHGGLEEFEQVRNRSSQVALPVRCAERPS